MRNKKGNKSLAERWVRIGELITKELPHLAGVLSEEDDFIEMRLKARQDGTTLGILKRFGSDGGELVCFGAGYGAFAALLALDATVNGGNWRTDKPWPGKGGQ